MKNKINIIKTSCLLGLLLLGVNPFLTAKTEKMSDSAKVAQMENWKRSPHSLLVGCGTLLAPEAHKIYTKMALGVSLTYQYDIPWQHKRTNFFVTAGAGYEGCYRDGKPYRAKNDIIYENYIYDNFHVYAGAGLKVRLAYFLDFSFSAAIDGSISREFGRYPSFYGTSIAPSIYDEEDGSYRVRRNPTMPSGIRGLFSIALAYEIKNFRISAGCQAYVGYLNDLLVFGPSEPKAMPFNSWAIFGLGYRF